MFKFFDIADVIESMPLAIPAPRVSRAWVSDSDDE
jgi:hypothetical protein